MGMCSPEVLRGLQPFPDETTRQEVEKVRELLKMGFIMEAS
jgi:hypothetical protein